MSTHFDLFTTGMTDGHLYVPCGDSPPVTVPCTAPRKDPAPRESRALVTPDGDEDEENEWDDFELGAETDWEWIDDADLFDDLFDDSEPLEDVDWVSRDRDDDDGDL